MKQYDIITFTQVENRILANQPLPKRLLITRELLHMAAAEVRPMTLTNLIKAVATNFGYMTKVRFYRALYKSGMLSTAEGCIPRLRDIRFIPEDWKNDLP